MGWRDGSGLGHALESVGIALAAPSCQSVREAATTLLLGACRPAYWTTVEVVKALAARHRIGSKFPQAHYYDLLTRPWRLAVGPLHPEDPPLGGEVAYTPMITVKCHGHMHPREGLHRLGIRRGPLGHAR